jgi:hypothetical protein
MYAIEKNVPVPKEIIMLKVRGRPPLYPFRCMDVGDSFYVPLGDRNVIWTCGNRVRRELGFQFRVKDVQGGVRVWRIK